MTIRILALGDGDDLYGHAHPDRVDRRHVGRHADVQGPGMEGFGDRRATGHVGPLDTERQRLVPACQLQRLLGGGIADPEHHTRRDVPGQGGGQRQPPGLRAGAPRLAGGEKVSDRRRQHQSHRDTPNRPRPDQERDSGRPTEGRRLGVRLVELFRSVGIMGEPCCDSFPYRSHRLCQFKERVGYRSFPNHGRPHQ